MNDAVGRTAGRGGGRERVAALQVQPSPEPRPIDTTKLSYICWTTPTETAHNA